MIPAYNLTSHSRGNISTEKKEREEKMKNENETEVP
jgi:hypothetical protein